MTTTAVAPGSARAWLIAIRPRTLTAGLVPVLVGTSLAAHDGSWRPALAIACAIVACAVQIATNLVNDYADHKRGADAERVGPVRVTSAGLLTPRQVKIAAIGALVVAGAAGLPIVIVGGWPYLVVGILALASAVLYTAGPAPLGYLGLGDLFVFVFFGLVATVGTYGVQADQITATAIVYGVALGLISVAMLAVNNLRDLDTDRAAGKRTLAVRIGRIPTKVEIGVSIGLAILLPIVPAVLGWVEKPTLIALSAGVFAPGIFGALWRDDGTDPKALVGTLGLIARMQLVFGATLSVGLLV